MSREEASFSCRLLCAGLGVARRCRGKVADGRKLSVCGYRLKAKELAVYKPSCQTVMGSYDSTK